MYVDARVRMMMNIIYRPTHAHHPRYKTITAANTHPPTIPSLPKQSQCKSLEHEYEPSKRTDSWLKVKKDYIEGLHDTLDLVPIAAWCDIACVVWSVCVRACVAVFESFVPVVA